MIKLRYAVIGAGTWGELHAEACFTDPEVELAMVCDIDPKKAQVLAERFGAKGYTTDWREIAQDPTIDAVSVATPDFAHTEPAVAVLQAGKHALVEKPLATTVEEAARIVEAADDAQVFLMVDFHNRWNLPYANAKQAALAGRLGDIRYFYGRQSLTQYWAQNLMEWADKTSTLWFCGSHTIDLARWFMEDEVESVFAVSRKGILAGKGIDTEDLIVTILEFERGGVAVIENTWLVPDTDPAVEDFQVEVLGTLGGAYMETFHDRSLVIYGRDRAEYPDMFVRPVVWGQTKGFAIESIRHFIECVKTGVAPAVTGHDGLVVTRIGVAALESARTGRKVKLG